MDSPRAQTPVPRDVGGCPACHKPRTAEGKECPYCGIVYARFKTRPSRPGRASPIETPSPSSAESSVASTSGALERSPVRPLSLRQRELFFSTLAEAIEAGLTIAQFAHGPALRGFPKSLVEPLRGHADKGEPLSAILAALRLLDQASTAVLLAGEHAGEVPASLRVFARRAARQRKDRGLLVILLIYPALLVFAAIVIIPLPSILRVGLTGYLWTVGGRLFTLGAIATTAVVILPRLDPDGAPRRGMRAIASLIPGLGFTLKHQAISTFADTLGTCIAAGIAIRRALPLAARGALHPAFQKKADVLVEKIDAGESLGKALETISILPGELLALAGHAEQVGKLDVTFARLAKEHEKRARVAMVSTLIASGVLAISAVFIYLTYSIASGWIAYFTNIAQQVEGIFKF